MTVPVHSLEILVPVSRTAHAQKAFAVAFERGSQTQRESWCGTEHRHGGTAGEVCGKDQGFKHGGNV